MKPWEQYAGSGTEQAGTDALDTESTKPWEVAKQKAAKPLPASFSKTPEQLKAEIAQSQSEEAPTTLGEFGNQLTEGIYGGINKAVRGVAAIPGALMESVRQTVADPLGAIKAVPGALLDIADQTVRYPIEAVSTGIAGTPRQAGEVIGEGGVMLGAGPTLGVGKQVIQGAAGAGARKIVNTIIKPSLKDQAFKKDPTGAILKHKITGNSDADFAANVQGKIDELTGAVDQKLAASTKTVPVNEVTSLLDSEVKRIKGSIGISNKETLLSRIEELQNDILSRYAGQKIPLTELHAIRKEIDSNITRFTMDAVEQGANASKYEARTGINKLIERQEPGVQALNKDVSELLSAKEALERTANRTRNAGFGGPGDVATGVAGEVLAQGLGKMPGVGGVTAIAAKKAVGSTAVKSRVAKYLNTLAGGEEAAAIPKAGALSVKLSDEERNQIQQLADAYVSKNGGKLPAHKTAEIKENLSKSLADFYETSKHTPDDPKVAASYKALADETMDQWDAIHDAGYTLEKWTGEGEPYANSAAMISDVRDKKHLYYKPSDTGFGTGAEGTKQLMMGESRVPGVPVNDVFRAVHDFFGHAKEGNQFGPKGEFNAWLIHSDMYGPEAQGALAAETLAQNSAVNFGRAMRNAEGNIIKKGEAGYLGPTERPFAEQKNIVVPDELIASAKGAPKGTADSIIKAGGGTFTPEGRQVSNTQGYQVSIAGHEKTVPISQLTPEKADALFSEYGELAKQNGGSVGVWIEGDNAVWDVSKHFTDRNKAIEFGNANNQRAIWNWGKGEAENLSSSAVKLSEGSNAMTAAELDSMEAGLSNLPKGQRGITQRFIAENRAKLKKERPAVAIKGSTVEAVDAEAQAQDMVDAWVDEFKGGAPKKTKGTNYETGRRVYEGQNFGDVPGLNKVGAGDEAIVRALNTQEGPVWEKINQAARDEVQKSAGKVGLESDATFKGTASEADLSFDPTKFSEREPAGKAGTFREESFELPGKVESTYKGPERRKEPRGTIREEEFEWPAGVKEAEPAAAGEARGYNPRRGKIVLSDENMLKVQETLGHPRAINGAEIFSGTAAGGEDAAGRNFISALKKAMPKEFAMVPTNKPLVIQRVGDSQFYKQTARHEALHRAANEVLGGKIEIDASKLSPEAKLLMGFSKSKKRNYAAGKQAEEVLAELATGNPIRLGMTRGEGLQLLHELLEQLHDVHGPEKVGKLMERFAPRFYESAPERVGKTLPKFKSKNLNLPDHVEVVKIGENTKADGFPQNYDIYDINVKGGPQNITFYLPEGGNLKAKVDEMAKAWNIKLSEQAKGEPTWYGTAKERLEEIGKQHGVELRTLAGVAAALSPNNRWAQNVVDVKKWAAAYKAGTLHEKSSAGTFGKNRAKAFRIMNGEDPEKVLQGPKVKAFFKALIGEGDEPVVDFHMANILRGDGYKTTKETAGITAKEYKELAQQLLDEASAAGMKPADYQAKRWIEHRDKGQTSLFPEKGGK